MSKYNGCAYNYHGSKARFLPTLESILPKEGSISVLDVFNGANSLGSQLPVSWKITANDKESRLVDIHKDFQKELITSSPEELAEFIRVFCHSYVDKAKDSSGYHQLVEDYNNDQTPLRLYALLCSSFSNQLRWNSSGAWNVPWGARFFNTSMEKKLLQHLHNINTRDISFTSRDFREFNFDEYDLVISDSPYLKTCASYQEQGKWGFKDSINLMTKLTKHGDNGGKFLMFEELWSKGKPNTQLIEWATQYNIKQLGNNSDKCNYQRKGGKTQEVIIFNF